MKNNNLYILLLIPFVINYSLVMVILGVSNWGPYNVNMIGFQVRILGILIILFCYGVINDVFLKYITKNNKKYVLKAIFSSLFIYFWAISIVLLFTYIITRLYLIKYIYLISLALCIYYQYLFIKEVKKYFF